MRNFSFIVIRKLVSGSPERRTCRKRLRTAYSCGDPAARDGAIALILLTQDGAYGADSFFSLCTERLKGMFISFFPGEERNEPKKEATDQ